MDSNVLACIFDDAEPEKQKLIAERQRAEQRERELVVSTQVLRALRKATRVLHGGDPDQE